MLKYLVSNNDEINSYQERCEMLERENKKLKRLVDSLQFQVHQARADSKRFDASIYL